MEPTTTLDAAKIERILIAESADDPELRSSPGLKTASTTSPSHTDPPATGPTPWYRV
jgi:hypothetical protein